MASNGQIVIIFSSLDGTRHGCWTLFFTKELSGFATPEELLGGMGVGTGTPGGGAFIKPAAKGWSGWMCLGGR